MSVWRSPDWCASAHPSGSDFWFYSYCCAPHFLGVLRIPNLATRSNAIPWPSFWPRRSFTGVHDQTGSLLCASPQRRVAHAKARADMFGNEFDRWTVLQRIGLRQILHGVDEQALPIHVTRI